MNTRICANPFCVNAGKPQPAKHFVGDSDECHLCRPGAGVKHREMSQKARDKLLYDNGYDGPPRPVRQWELPPGCMALVPGQDVRLKTFCDPGEGVPVLTNPDGHVIVRDVPGLRPGEYCYVLR